MKTYADWPGDGQGLEWLAHVLIRCLIRSFSIRLISQHVGLTRLQPSRIQKGCVLDDPRSLFFFFAPHPPATHQLSVSEYEGEKKNMTVVKSTTAVINSMYISVCVSHYDGQRATFHVTNCYSVVFLNENTHSSFPIHASYSFSTNYTEQLKPQCRRFTESRGGKAQKLQKTGFFFLCTS